MPSLKELHSFLDDTEENLRSHGGNIGFEVHSNASRGGIPSDYEMQFYNQGQRPVIVYNEEQGLYYYSQGPRLTPGKRPYPTRYWNGELDGSQPEFYYSTVQQVEFAIILERISETQYRVMEDATMGWPSAPFYLYLAQKDEGSGENPTQAWGETYRYVKIDGDDAKIHVSAFEDNILTLATPLEILVPEEEGEGWTEYIESPYVFAFFERRIDDLLAQTVTNFGSDAYFLGITMTDFTTVLEVENVASFQIRIADVYEKEEDGTFTFIESSMANPVVDQEIFILLRGAGGTLINSDRVTIINVDQVDSEDVLLYAELDPSDPFINLDVDAIDDPFDRENEGEDDPSTPSMNVADVTGKITYRYYQIRISPYVLGLTAELSEIAYFEETVQRTSEISDEELSVELFGTAQSLRPHTFHLLSPLKAPSYSDVYNFNWAAPLPYPVKTTVEDCEEPSINGYFADDLTVHRMAYDRERNSWNVGGVVFCICRNFEDAGIVEDCILKHNYHWYFKLRGLDESLKLYHLAVEQW